MTTVKITQVGFQTLTSLSRYSAQFVGAEQALEIANNMLDIANRKLKENPLQFAVCHELECLGVNDYRQITLEKHKILFRYDTTANTAYVTAFMRQKQSAQQLLIDYLLLG